VIIVAVEKTASRSAVKLEVTGGGVPAGADEKAVSEMVDDILARLRYKDSKFKVKKSVQRGKNSDDLKDIISELTVFKLKHVKIRIKR